MDAGNSRIKWRLSRAGQTLDQGVVSTPDVAALAQVWQRLGWEASCVSSVAGGEVNEFLRSLLATPAGGGPCGTGDAIQIHWVAAAARSHGIVSSYQPPETLGPDRYCALVAANRQQVAGSPQDWVVVNVGTALTADMLTADGVFLGGVILPGPDLMREALARGTARVIVEDAAVQTGWPVTTRAAVGQGIGWALWGGVAGMLETLGRETGRLPGVLLSGGARAMLVPRFLAAGVELREIDELVLEGLAWIARDQGLNA
ncbi:MAG: type III pantothenate kinase [Pseudomonadota bacterium]